MFESTELKSLSKHLSIFKNVTMDFNVPSLQRAQDLVIQPQMWEAFLDNH